MSVVKGYAFTTYLMENGSIVSLIGVPVCILLTAILACCFCACKGFKLCRKVIHKLDKILFFSMVIRVLLVAYLNFCITAFTTFFITQNNLKTGSIIFGLVIGIWIASLLFAVLAKQEKLNDEKFRYRYGSLYANLRTNAWYRVG